MNRLLTKVAVGTALGILVYVAVVVWADARRVAGALAEFRGSALVLALLLSTVNYGLRFAKWELALGWLEVRRQGQGPTRGRSLLIYVAGLSMAVTPGKLGEVVRSWLLRASDGVPVTRTAPVVVADRLTDLVALAMLSMVGIAAHLEYLAVLIATMVLVVVVVLVLGSPRALRAVLDVLGRFGPLRGASERLGALVDSSAVVLRADRLALLSLISAVGWGLECVGFFLIVGGFSGTEPDLRMCTFLWALTTLIGAVSFLPGGLGATEGSLVLLSQRLVGGVTPEIAVGATLLIRVATLWFAEVLGAIALLLFLRDPAIRARIAQPE